jgi:site-specific recombinase XerD
VKEESFVNIKNEILDILSRLKSDKHPHLLLEWNPILEILEKKSIPEKLVDFIKLNYPRDKSAKYYKGFTENLLKSEDKKKEFHDILLLSGSIPEKPVSEKPDKVPVIENIKSIKSALRDPIPILSDSVLDKIPVIAKKKSIKRALRDPIPNDFYYYLLDVQKKRNESSLKRWQKKVIYVLLYEFGIRAGDLRKITSDQLKELLLTSTIYIFVEKTRAELPFCISSKGRKLLLQFWETKEKTKFFKKYNTLGGSFSQRLESKSNITQKEEQYARQDFVNSINKDLKLNYQDYLKTSVDKKLLKLNTHSFRIAFINAHLKKGIYVAQDLVHHKDIRSTQRYRFRLSENQRIAILNKRDD